MQFVIDFALCWITVICLYLTIKIEFLIPLFVDIIIGCTMVIGLYIMAKKISLFDSYFDTDFTSLFVINKISMFYFGSIVIITTLHIFARNHLMDNIFGWFALIGLGYMIIKKMWTIHEKIRHINRKFCIDLNNTTHPCDILIATEQRIEYLAYKESIADKNSFAEIDMDAFEKRARHILDKQYIQDYFGYPISNLEIGSYLEIPLNTEWKVKAAEFFVDNGLDYLGLPNCFELVIVDSSVLFEEYFTVYYSVLLVRRRDCL